jgi:hypothetical protein
MPDLDSYYGLAASDSRSRAREPQLLQSIRALATSGNVAQQHEHRLERLTDRLPRGLQTTVRWLRKPSSRWVRIPTGFLLIVGGVLSILPLLGLWMLPLGFLLLAEDVPPLATRRDRALDWIERHRPHWLRDPIS